jgi:hypothetical protein
MTRSLTLGQRVIAMLAAAAVSLSLVATDAHAKPRYDGSVAWVNAALRGQGHATNTHIPLGPQLRSVDANRDGKPDTLLLDFNKDGRWDRGFADIDGDGRFDHRWVDRNRNGNAERGETKRLSIRDGIRESKPRTVDQDADGDGIPEKRFYDKDGDGDADVILENPDDDSNPDGTPNWDGGRNDSDRDDDYDNQWTDANDDGDVQKGEVQKLTPEQPVEKMP